VFYPWITEGSASIVVNGTAEELAGRRFNFIVLDGENYYLWRAGQPYNAFYEVRNVTACSFSYPLTLEQTRKISYFVVQRAETGVDINVRISANISYVKPTKISVEYDVVVSWEEKSYVQVLGGPLLGVGLLFFGVISMIAAAIMKYVFE